MQCLNSPRKNHYTSHPPVWLKWSRTQWVSWALKLFCVPRFLIAGSRLHTASKTFPGTQRAGSNSCSSVRGGDAETREERSETIVQAWDRVLVSLQVIHITISLGYFTDTETTTPHQLEEVNCMLSTSTWTPSHLELEGWWSWLQITSPPANQKNVLELITLSTLNYYYKTLHYFFQVRTQFWGH